MLFDIYFKINLVVSVGFKVKKREKLAFERSLKNLKRKFKYCNVDNFQLINFYNSQLASPICNILYLQKRLNHVSLFFQFSSLFGKT